MARSDSLIVPGEEETSGMSCNIRIGAQVAREMIEAGEWENVVSKWAVESRRRWENSKFVKLWQASQAAGLDPEEEFRSAIWDVKGRRLASSFRFHLRESPS